VIQHLLGLLGPPGSALRRVRLLLAIAAAALLGYCLGPYAPWRLPGAPTLVPGPGQSRVHTVLVGIWWAALANALACGVLLASARRWLPAAPVTAPRAPRSSRPGPGLWLLLLAAAALAGALRWPLATGSVWWDEAWSLRKVVVGSLVPDTETRRVEFEPASWLDTLWNYRQPTNHVAYSVAARVSLAGWRGLGGGPPQAFDELAFRLPAWLAALGSVVLLGLLVHALGFPGAAGAAAFLLAIHPWHIRYGADGRGYSFVVLLSLASALCLLRALREDRWRSWLGAGACHALLLWTMPIAVYVPLALCGAAALAIASGPRAGRRRFARLVVANVLAAMAYLQVMAPNLAQALLLERLLGEEARFDSGWLRQLWVFATTGLHLRMPRLEDVWYPDLASLTELRGASPFVVYGLLPALVLGGGARALRRGDPAGRAVILGLCAAPLLLVLHRAVDGFFAYPRFAIYALVPVTALLAVGAEGLLRLWPGARGRRVVVAAGLVAALVGYQALVAPLTAVLLRHPQSPAREVAEFIGRQPAASPDGALRVGLGLGGFVPQVYDPWIETLDEAQALVEVCRRAAASGRPLYVFFSHAALNRQRFPETFALVGDPRLFEPVARFDGVESEHVFRVLRYTGAPLAAAGGETEPGAGGL
jgi:hypothetical protein